MPASTRSTSSPAEIERLRKALRKAAISREQQIIGMIFDRGFSFLALDDPVLCSRRALSLAL